ncbi:sulfite exporter TauE/SafE family protein [Paragemmobacter ruber]|uniref:Probable membrane transporter protein n=1 Tax=Paragemmobacter ruber TaxID=1985673 RepID=A0ABW9Y3M3_9RHOB|nr:sulfite exporter TauE/SafE family protein [Rhodobacter ruber]NBE06470.1 TSUP family transporter [Rhodobacter ruber]
MQGWDFWLIAVAVAFLVGLAKGGWSAVGNLSVPLLSLVVDPLTAAGLLLPVYIVSDAFGLWAYRHSYARRVLTILIPAGIAGVLIGWAVIPWTSAHLPGGNDIITGLVGAIGILFALYMLTGPKAATVPRAPRVRPGLFWGTITGFTSYISHAGAPPYQVYVQPLGLDRLAYAGTTTILFAVLNAVKLGPYALTGQVTLQSLETLAYLSPAAILGVYIGKRTVGMVSERTFYRVITWALLIVGVNLLGRALIGTDPFLALARALS